LITDRFEGNSTMNATGEVITKPLRKELFTTRTKPVLAKFRTALYGDDLVGK
jgi:hypothetical protein